MSGHVARLEAERVDGRDRESEREKAREIWGRGAMSLLTTNWWWVVEISVFPHTCL